MQNSRKQTRKKTAKKGGRRKPRGSRGQRPATKGVGGTARGDQLVNLPLLGDHFECRHMLYYDSNFEHNGTSGVLLVHYFRANDLFDPDAATGGHQPVGFDQAMLFWEQFCVFSSKISVTFMSNTNTPVRVGIFLSPDTTNPASVSELMENGYLRTKVLFGASSTAQGGAFHTLGSLSLNFDAPRYFSSKNRETYFANPNFTGTVAASPAEMAYFGVFTYDMAGTTTYDVFYDVTLSYDARFWEPRKIASSFYHEALRNALLAQEAKKKAIAEGKKPPDEVYTYRKGERLPPYFDERGNKLPRPTGPELDPEDMAYRGPRAFGSTGDARFLRPRSHIQNVMEGKCIVPSMEYVHLYLSQDEVNRAKDRSDRDKDRVYNSGEPIVLTSVDERKDSRCG